MNKPLSSLDYQTTSLIYKIRRNSIVFTVVQQAAAMFIMHRYSSTWSSTVIVFFLIPIVWCAMLQLLSSTCSFTARLKLKEEAEKFSSIIVDGKDRKKKDTQDGH